MKKRIGIFLISCCISCFANAQTDEVNAKLLEAKNEMNRMTDKDANSRSYLLCASWSSYLNMPEMYGVFVRKASESAKTADGLAMSLAWSIGFVESEILRIQGSLGPKEAGETIGTFYKLQCLKYIFPKN
jgi:hypothetical protein